jgi:hypothetical protein
MPKWEYLCLSSSGLVKRVTPIYDDDFIWLKNNFPSIVIQKQTPYISFRGGNNFLDWDALNMLGELGWEAYYVVKRDSSPTFFLKRQKE